MHDHSDHVGHPRLPYAGRRCLAPMPQAAAISMRGVRVGYDGASRPALADVSLTIMPGSSAALVGGNGAGKSTLLKAVAGLVPLAAGELLLAGRPRGACHHHVGYLPQRGVVDWTFPISVRRMVVTGRYAHLGWLRRPGPADWAVADDALAQLDMRALAERQIGELSGGQQQRLLLARLLAQGPALLLLDEPLNEVDAESSAAFIAAVRRWRQAHPERAVVTATHQPERSGWGFDQIICLEAGRLSAPQERADVLVD